jgi:G patch domain-containing protein 1
LGTQEVLDSEGRKRLHGAFTGGFSAGYFNTVGSKEGWTPAAFVSSRSNRAKIAEQRAEDFMDAEDIAEKATGGKQVFEVMVLARQPQSVVYSTAPLFCAHEGQ